MQPCAKSAGLIAGRGRKNSGLGRVCLSQGWFARRLQHVCEIEPPRERRFFWVVECEGTAKQVDGGLDVATVNCSASGRCEPVARSNSDRERLRSNGSSSTRYR